MSFGSSIYNFCLVFEPYGILGKPIYTQRQSTSWEKDEESDFVNTREMIKEDIVNFFKRITNVFKIRRKRWKKLN